MSSLRIALIGYGAIGRVHAHGYRALPFLYGVPPDFARVVAVATSRPETAQAAAAELGCEVWSADYRAIVARDDVDVIDCCTPNGAHHDIVIAAARAGKHIYCEKPLALDVAEGTRMVAAAQQAGVHTQMTFNFRFFPALARARQLIAEGFLGRVFSFRARYFRSRYIDPQLPLSWKLRMRESGGGALVDLGAHALDLVYSLLGEVESVQAALDTAIRERPVARGSSAMAAVDVDDMAFMHVRLAGGALGIVEASRLATGSTNDLLVEIYGEHGALRFRLDAPDVLEVYDTHDGSGQGGSLRRVQTGSGYAHSQIPDWSMAPDFLRAHADCQYHFLKAITEGRAPTPSLADGLHIQAIMAAAQRSAAAGGWVRVADVLPPG